MFKGLGDMAGLMKQAQELQTKMNDAQDRLDDIHVTGISGAGLVKVTMTAKGAVTAIDIDASILTPDDKSVIEDLLRAAFVDAQSKAQSASQDEMGKLTSDLNLPPGMKFPF